MKTLEQITTEAAELVAAGSRVINLTPAEVGLVIAETELLLAELEENDSAIAIHSEYATVVALEQPAPLKVSAARIHALTSLLN